MTIEHDTVRQSIEPMSAEIWRRTTNRPPALNGVASAVPYGGGFDEIHADAGLVPDVLTPPPHGDGICPLRGVTQSAT